MPHHFSDVIEGCSSMFHLPQAGLVRIISTCVSVFHIVTATTSAWSYLIVPPANPNSLVASCVIINGLVDQNLTICLRSFLHFLCQVVHVSGLTTLALKSRALAMDFDVSSHQAFTFLLSVWIRAIFSMCSDKVHASMFQPIASVGSSSSAFIEFLSVVSGPRTAKLSACFKLSCCHRVRWVLTWFIFTW